MRYAIVTALASLLATGAVSTVQSQPLPTPAIPTPPPPPTTTAPPPTTTKPPPSPTPSPTPPDQSCVLEYGVNYVGNDIGGTPAASPEECCDKCRAFPGCRAFTYSLWWAENVCFFKSGKAGTNPDPSVVSCAVGLKDGQTFAPTLPPATTTPPPTPTTTKPPPSPTPSPTPPDQSCVLEYGVNYVGNDIGGTPAASPEECCDKCRAFPGCRAFTYSLWWAENVCFFKSGKAGTNPDPSVVSCAVGLKDGQTFAPTLPPATTTPPPTPTTTKPPPSPTPSPTPPDQSCVLEYGVNYVGNDIGGTPAASPEECCDKCRAFPGCRAFTYSLWWAENVCFFKSGKAGTNPDPSVVSCAVGLKDGQTFAPTLPPATTTPPPTPTTTKPPPSPTPSPTPPDQSCVLEYGVNYVGNDIGGTPAASPEECCDKCRAFPGCRAFTYSLWWAENVCFFKSGKAGTNPDPSVVSCAVGLKDGQTFAPTLPPATSPKISLSPSARASLRPRA